MTDKMNLFVFAPASRQAIRVPKDMLSIFNTFKVLRFIISVKMVCADMILAINLLWKQETVDASKFLRSIDSYKLLIQLACSIMKRAEGINISFKHWMCTFDFWVKAKVKISPEEIVFIGGLSSKAMNQYDWAIIFPQFFWVLQVLIHHVLMLRFVYYTII